MMRRHALIVPTLLALASLAGAADLHWNGVPDGKPPAPWAVAAGKSATVGWVDGGIEIAASSATGATASVVLDGRDGSDAEPLRISAIVSVAGERVVDGTPALVAVSWAGGGVFAVGLGEDPHSKRDERRAWAMWSGNGKAGSHHAESSLASGAVPAHLRIVVTGGEVAAYGSRDGWTWTRVAGVARSEIAANGAPERLAVGRGQIRAGQATLSGDPVVESRGRPGVYRFAAMRVERGPAEVPASLIRSYAKQESLGDTTDALAASGRPRVWRLRGPESASRTWPPLALPEMRDGWIDHQIGERDRVIQVGRQLPSGNELIRWAETVLPVAEAGWHRLLFDGTRQCWLWVDGRLISASDRDDDEAEPDRQSALVWLSAGDHRVTLGLRGGKDRTVAALRWEPGDPRYRIALLQRLLIDFPDDEGLAGAQFEIARLWDGLGFARMAAESLAPVAATAGGGESAERALAERARLFRQLRDEPAAAAEIDGLSKLWSGAESDKLTTALRTAQLWQRLDVPERALAALAEAIALPDIPASTRCELAIERARLRKRQSDTAGVAQELRAAAQFLPANDDLAFELRVLALRTEAQAGTGTAEAAEQLAKSAQTVLRARLIAGLHGVRKDEAARIAARKSAAALPADGLDAPAIDLAEQLVAAKDEAGAIKLYQTEAARLRVPVAGGLPQLRAAVLRGALAQRSAGAAMLAAADALPPGTAPNLTWRIAGPVPVDDWKALEKPSFDVARGADAGAVGGKPWREVPAAALAVSGVVDLRQAGMADNAVMYLATTITSATAMTQPAAAGADDALAVWVNGERIHADRTQRAVETDAIPLLLPLKAGVNTIVCAVQNGVGGSGFQFRLKRDPWPACDLSAALGLLAESPAGRIAAGNELAVLAESLLRMGRHEEASAVIRAVIRSWPDSRDLQYRLFTRSTLWERQWVSFPAHIQEVGEWLDCMRADVLSDDAPMGNAIRDSIPDHLLLAGRPTEAMARLRRSAALELDPLPVARLLLTEASIWLRYGQPRLAVQLAAKARIAACGDERIESEADRLTTQARSMKGALSTVNTPFEIGNLLRTAERAAGAKDAARAAADWQKSIETGRDQPVAVAQGRIRGAAVFAAGRLRRVAGDSLAEWHARQDNRAAGALATAMQTGDVFELERVAERWPLAPAAGTALSMAADLWASRGAWPLALGTAQDCLDDHAPADRPRMLARAAHAALRAGDETALTACLADLARAGGQVRWDGADIPVAKLAEILRQQRPAVVQADPRTVGAVIRMPPAGTAESASAAVGGMTRTLAAQVSGDAIFAATLDGVVCVGDDGAVRWQSRSRMAVDPALAVRTDATPAAALAIDGGVVVALQHLAGVRSLVAMDRQSGQVLWDASNAAGLAGVQILSAPQVSGGLVWVLVAERGLGHVRCLDARDGRLVWSSRCGPGQMRLAFGEGAELDMGGDAAAPALVGRDLIVGTDAGQIHCLDAVTGALRWVQTYPRTMFGPWPFPEALGRLISRARAPILADGGRLFIAPRDCLSLLALDRGTGAVLWSRDLADVRDVVGISAQGLITIGDSISCLDPATGADRWRWSSRPGDPGPTGRPALTADAVWVGTDRGLLRLAVADGKATQVADWSALGLAADPPTSLLADGPRLLACGHGTAARLGPALQRVAAEIAWPDPARINGPALARDAAPTAVQELWELPVGQVRTMFRPSSPQPGEMYFVADGKLLRLEAVSGRIVWSTPAEASAEAEIQVVGKHVMLHDGTTTSVWDRDTGVRRWLKDVATREMRGRRSSWMITRSSLGDDAVVSWRSFDNWYAVRSAADGKTIHAAAQVGEIIQCRVVDGSLHLVLRRSNRLCVEIRSLPDGRVLGETIIGTEDQRSGASMVLDDGSILISSSKGTVRWLPTERAVKPTDLGLTELLTWYRDGSRIVVIGKAGSQDYQSIVFDPATGRNLAAHAITTSWSSNWREQLPRFERVIGDIRVRTTVRGQMSGILGEPLAGGEAFWLSPINQHGRWFQAVVPVGGRAVVLSNDQTGAFRAQVVDVAAGKLEVESTLGFMPRFPMQTPLSIDGAIVIATARGISAIGLVEAPAQAQPPLLAGRSDGRLVIDGHVDDWTGLPVFPVESPVRMLASGATPALGMQARLAWTPTALALAVEIPLQPGAIGRVQVAADTREHAYAYQASPLILDLSWSDGRPTVQILNTVVADDPLRAPVVARASAGPAGTVWEVSIPWAWLRSSGTPGGAHDPPLRVGAAAWSADGVFALEWGDGLVRGRDKSRLVRVRQEEKKR